MPLSILFYLRFHQTSSSKHVYHEEQHEETYRQEMSSSHCEYDDEDEETECISNSPTDEHTQSVAGGEVLAEEWQKL